MPETAPKVYRAFKVAFVVLLAVGVLVRVYGAWCHQFSRNVDFAVTALIARHMATGQGFPVFFYGQEMMGTLESVPGAVLCALFGCSRLMVCLGTALLSLLTLPVTAAWAYRARGPRAAAAAAAWCVIGPRFWFVYGTRTQDYAVIALLGTAIVWLACRLATGGSTRRREAVDWGLLGLCAGLGWWSSQLIVAPVLAAAIVLAVFARRRLFAWRTLLVLPAGLIGSAPWWLWNVQHGFQSLKLGSSFTLSGMGRAWAMLLRKAIPRILDSHRFPAPLAALLLCLVGAALVATVVILIPTLAKRNPAAQRSAPALAAVPVLIAVLCLFFGATEFGQTGSARYLLPLVPALAVALGVATDIAVRRVGPAGWLPLLLLVGLQVHSLPASRQRALDDHAALQQARAAAGFLREHDIDAVYSDIRQRWMNMAFNEDPCFWPIQGFRYRPHWERIETTARPAVLDRAGGVDAFLQSSGGTVSITNIAGLTLHHDFRPPAGGRRELAPAAFHASTGGKQRSAATLSDQVYSTGPAFDRTGGGTIEIDLAGAEPVHMLRLVLRSRTLPAAWQIDGADTRSGAWRALTPRMTCTDYYWSGPRPYWRGQFRRLECRFAPTHLQRLRVRFFEGRSPGQIETAELQVFAPAPAPAAEADHAEGLCRLLRERRIVRLYCDRWIGHRVRRSTTGVEVIGEPYIRDSSDPPPDLGVRLDAATALLVRAEDRGPTQAALAQAGVTMQVTPLGPWEVYGRPRGRQVHALRWVGFGCLLSSR